HGVGISPAVLKRIFLPFEQEDRTHGIGLGLAIAKGLVEQQGGTIEARSNGPGAGATCTVELPTSSRRCSPASRARRSRGGPRPAPAPAAASSRWGASPTPRA